MAKGRIPDSDIAAIRERTPIEEVVGEYVQLKPAGSDSMKGLSPFKDEKTPSFHVRPNKGYYHCFSTGKGGDVFSFLMEMEHLSFPEAVEQCADRIGYRINYEGGGPGRREEPGTRQRLVAINKAAHAFYEEQLSTEEAKPAREFLANRGFTPDHAAQFGCGYAPGGWDTLTTFLLRKGYDVKELEAAGVTSQGRRGPIDRFHRRLIWPIRNTAGDVIGFGARKLFDDDKLGKYMNTPETMLYKKSKVLFGIDQAKKSIATEHQAVIVEGYTDVMAMHAAGITTAVAACGTAFGSDHLQLIRRLMLDDKYSRGEIIYTFDGDEAGQKAAMRAFEGNQEFTGRSYVAVAPDGQDPCDLRLASGDGALRDLIANRVPMLEFVVRTIVDGFDLRSTEGRLQALRAAAPAVGQISDATLRKAYARKLAGWLGWSDVDDVLKAVEQEARRPRSQSRLRVPASRRQKNMKNGNRGPGGWDATGEGAGGGSWNGAGSASLGRGGSGSLGHDASARSMTAGNVSGGPRSAGGGTAGAQVRFTWPNPHNPELVAERESLKIALQEPGIAGVVFDSLPGECFVHPTYRAVAEAIEEAGGCASGQSGAAWLDHVVGFLPEMMGRAMVSELAVEPIHCLDADLARYADSMMASLQAAWIGEKVAELKSALERMRPSDNEEAYRQLFGDLIQLEQYKKSLEKRSVGQRDL